MNTGAQNFLSGLLAKVFVAIGVSISTCIAWVLYALLVHGNVDNLADAWVRSVGHTLGGMFSLDPTVAAIFLPLATFAAIALGALLFARTRT